MHMPRSGGPGVQTVIAAQAGDAEALDSLLSSSLPLIYNIVGRGLSGHADVDDVVQETMLRAVRGLGDLRDPAAFRSWLVAVAIRQMRDHYRARQAVAAADLSDEVADPEADFVELTILRLGLSSQREETAQATRWLDAGDRELLALWWLEAAGELDRNELVAALGLPANPRRGAHRAAEGAAHHVPGGGAGAARRTPVPGPGVHHRGLGRGAQPAVAQADRPAHPRLRALRGAA